MVLGVGVAPADPFWPIVINLLVFLCLAYHVKWIFPFTRLARVEVPDSSEVSTDTRLSIISANVETPNRNAAGLLALIKRYDPDIVLTLETNLWWENQLSDLRVRYPHVVSCPLENLYGMHLFSKYALVDTKVQFLIESDVPSIHTVIDLGKGIAVRAHFLHPAPPSPTENDESLERDAELLIVGKSVAKSTGPVLIAGDLNDVAWSHTSLLFKKIAGLRDPRIGRALINTFHAKLPIIRFPLDHIYLSEHFSVRSLQRLPAFNSDHFAMYADLSVSQARVGETEVLPTEPDDHREALDTIEQVDASVSDVHRPSL